MLGVEWSAARVLQGLLFLPLGGRFGLGRLRCALRCADGTIDRRLGCLSPPCSPPAWVPQFPCPLSALHTHTSVCRPGPLVVSMLPRLLQGACQERAEMRL